MAKTLSEYTQTIHSSMTDIRGTLTELTEEDCSNIKLKDVNEKLGKISTGNKLNINITADDYDGATFTATHEDLETKATGVVSQKKATITVPKGGTYTVTNTDDEQSQEATLIDNVDLEFLKFSATIKVTVAEELIGETITCSLSGESLEQKAETTTVTFTVRKKGSWIIGVKGFTQITASVDVQDKKEYTTSLTVDPARVASIVVKSKTEDNGKTIKCTKGQTVLQKVLKDRKCTFILPETGEWKITCDDFPEITKTVNVSELKVYNCTYRADIFGVKITESESDPEKRVTYTDDAVGMVPVKVDQSSGTTNYYEWKDSWIFEKIYPVMLKTNGQIDYKLNPDNYSQKLGGGNSDVANINYGGNAMVCVEKFYTKFSMDGENELIQISTEKEDGFEAIGFIKSDDTEADRIFLPMFMGCFDSSEKLRSISGQSFKYDDGLGADGFNKAAQKNGNGYWIDNWATNQMMQAVYLILMKNCNPMAALGKGRISTDAKTGILNNKGAIACDPSSKAVKFMYIEDYIGSDEGSDWSSDLMRCEIGLYAQNGKAWIKMKPPYSSTSDYTQITDMTACTSRLYISKMKCSNQFGRYPVAYNGSNASYETSRWAGWSSGNSTYSRFLSGARIAGRIVDPDSQASGAGLTYIPPA